MDVARWLLQHKCDVNKPDDYGRTSLHVAAAVDCPEMVNLLIEWGGVYIAWTSVMSILSPVLYIAFETESTSVGLIDDTFPSIVPLKQSVVV